MAARLSSPALVHVRDLAECAAEGTFAVLLLSASGTGKGLFAQTIYAADLRQAGPFVPVDCVTIPRNLLEAEVFGCFVWMSSGS